MRKFKRFCMDIALWHEFILFWTRNPVNGLKGK